MGLLAGSRADLSLSPFGPADAEGFPLWTWRDGIFTAEECDRIVERTDRIAMEQGGLVGGKQQSNIRRCDLFWIDGQGDDAWIMDRIVDSVAQVNRDVFDFVLTDFAEKIQLTRYPEGHEGFYDWHVDRGTTATSRFRKLSMVVQLSEPEAYEGGRLEVNGAGIDEAIPTTRGGAVFFPAFVLHRVTPVLKGARYSLVTWVHGPHFR